MTARAQAHAKERPGDMLGGLLPSHAFRSDLLYFIRLAGNYAASIFISCRSKAPSNKRKQLALFLENYTFTDHHLKEALIQKKGWFDALKVEFPTFIEGMPVYLRERLSHCLQHDHALPMNHRAFSETINTLIQYRHYLEHYEEQERTRRWPSVSDSKLLTSLGLMLLPHLHNHLLGRIQSHSRKRRIKISLTTIQQMLKNAVSQRREASRFINGLKLKVDHEALRHSILTKYGNEPSDAAVHRIAKENRKKRQDLEHSKSAMLDFYRTYFPEDQWPRYNFQNFLIRYAFIGAAHIKEIEAFIFQPGFEGHRDFMEVIEPFFNVSMDIALLLHVWLSELEAEGVRVRNKKTVGSVIVALRNNIAHGGWIWNTRANETHPALSLNELLNALLALPHQHQLTDPQQRCNDLLTKLEAILRNVPRAKIYRKLGEGDDPNQRPPPITIRRWTRERRRQYSDTSQWQINKRPALRAIIAQWLREIGEARNTRKLTEIPEKC